MASSPPPFPAFPTQRVTPTPERRALLRRPVNEQVVFAGAGVEDGWALNFSIGGMRVLTSQPLPEDAPFGVQVPTGRGTALFLARVVWMRRLPDGVLAGLEFDRTPATSLDDAQAQTTPVEFAAAGIAGGWAIGAVTEATREIVVLTDRHLPDKGAFGMQVVDGSERPPQYLVRVLWAAQRLGGALSGIQIARRLG